MIFWAIYQREGGVKIRIRGQITEGHFWTHVSRGQKFPYPILGINILLCITSDMSAGLYPVYHKSKQ